MKYYHDISDLHGKCRIVARAGADSSIYEFVDGWKFECAGLRVLCPGIATGVSALGDTYHYRKQYKNLLDLLPWSPTEQVEYIAESQVAYQLNIELFDELGKLCGVIPRTGLIANDFFPVSGHMGWLTICRCLIFYEILRTNLPRFSPVKSRLSVAGNA